MTTQYEAVIGLEVHAQLKTKSKLFCGCSTAFGAPPNAQTCEVCLGLPGSLPMPNAHAIALALRAALGLGCQVHLRSGWSRKNYFYPDLPKGYQITQFDRPIATHGALTLDVDVCGKVAKITRIHIEEDAGKNNHEVAVARGQSYVDFNRGGIGLIEIVGEPDLRSSAEAAAYLKTLRQILRYLDVCDGNMDEGSLRCDANVSVRPVGTQALGTRCELKNINSFRFVSQAIDYEIARQVDILREGGHIAQQTRAWDSQAKKTLPLRSKEEAHDYRYFDEPNLRDLILSAHEVDRARQSLPELPAARRQRYAEVYGLSTYDARILTDEVDIARLFEDAVAAHDNPKGVANWIINEVLRECKGTLGVSKLPFGGVALAELVALIDANTISGKMAKELFVDMLKDGVSPKELVERRGLVQLNDTAALGPLVAEVLRDEAASVQKYRAGRTNVLGFLVGRVMQKTAGKANPQLVNTLLRAALDGEPAAAP